MTKEDAGVRWPALMTKQDAKLDLLRTIVVVKKRNTNLALLMDANTSTMNEQVKAWYLTEHGLILNQMPRPTATIGTTSSTAPMMSSTEAVHTTPPTTPTSPSPTTEEPIV
ncbi:putative methionyl-tRNA synthetase [Hordeum vulgare]|nr:putative methionyl-tRNA synthetase [Hordeum vulgare]